MGWEKGALLLPLSLVKGQCWMVPEQRRRLGAYRHSVVGYSTHSRQCLPHRQIPVECLVVRYSPGQGLANTVVKSKKDG